MQTFFAISTVVGYVLTLALLPLVLLTKKRQPVSTVAWVMAILTMPYLGAILFVVFGINRVERRVVGRRAVTRDFRRLLPELAGHQVAAEALNRTQRDLLRVAERVGTTRATVENRVQLLTDARKAFDEIESAIDSAQSSIHLEYYIWQPDKLGGELRDLLIAKAERGVRVRFLYDAIGSGRLTHKFLEPMRKAGIRVASFVPGQSFRERWSINLRSHRKIVIVDGTVGFTGGMNVGDEYLGIDPFFGTWRDTHLRLQGPTVLQLQEVFATDWHYATGEELTAAEFPQPVEMGDDCAQVIVGGPDTDEETFHSLLFAAINRAERHLTLATSYFVPTPPLVCALEAAALRGVRTRVMLSGPKTYWATRYAARAYYDTLLDAGVELYEYQVGQFHSKTLTLDGCWSLVGTANFDARSLYLNFEVGVVLYDISLAEQLENHFDLDIPNAWRLDPVAWSNRSTSERLKENLCKLFSPVL
ncbi:MAG: cardiolipin synthase [Planctomycetes bacterium]|nr:cardiolipin synthase [Planctomycetota bacterium]